MDKEHMYWGTMTYGDSARTRVPRVVYRCKVESVDSHTCKKVTDHEGICECICGVAVTRKK